MLPLHLVTEEILPRIYYDLPIDTRLAFGLKPRKLRCGALKNMLEWHLKKRMPKGNCLFWSEKWTSEPGIMHGNPYDRTKLNIFVYWVENNNELGYSVTKNWFCSSGLPILSDAGYTIGRKYISAMHFMTYHMDGECISNRFKVT